MVDIVAWVRLTEKLIENIVPEERTEWIINHSKMNITHERGNVFPSTEVLKVDLLELASELAVSVYGVEYDAEHIEYFKRLIKKHER